jgi:hypothetical protein
MEKHIFISYAHEDQEFVFKVATDLETRGARVWIDRGDIQGGEQWRESIETGIRDCQAFLLVVSPDSMKSSYVAQEIAKAETLDKPIFPLLYRNVKFPPELERLNTYQFINFRRGGYAQNLADLVTGLGAQGISLADAPELSPEEQEERRRQRLGGRVKPQWKAVFSKMFGWALAWALGWTLFWLVLPLLIAIFSDGEMPDGFYLLPLGGFAGGFIGGLFAGLVTMFVLRRHAVNIAWKHMSVSIRIWGFVGPLGTILAAWLAVALFNIESVNMLAGLDCSSIGLADCFGEIVGRSLGTFMAGLILLTLMVLAYALLSLLLIGWVAGWLTVRHIRRLEPGILGKQAFWVILGWGVGAVFSALASLLVMSPFLE